VNWHAAPYYQQQVFGPEANPALPPKSKLAVGYGDNSGQQQYFLRAGQDVDVGFLKLFLSTRSHDLRAIVQSSQFNVTPAPNPGLNRHVRFPACDTVTITVVQRKPDLRLAEEMLALDGARGREG
jgi:hypothetical protein